MNKGVLIWITGLSGAGKTAIGSEVYKILKEKYSNTIFVDGDVIRDLFNNDLGHTITDREQNAYRIANLCSFLTSQNMIVICSTMSLFDDIHSFNKINNEIYYEVYVDVSIEELKRRNSKGIYSNTNDSKAKNVIGIDLSYDIPKNPFMIIDNSDIKISANIKALEIIRKINFS